MEKRKISFTSKKYDTSEDLQYGKKADSRGKA